MDYAKESLKLHEQWKGKIEVVETVPVKSKEDLALAYTPGVAEPCLAIQKDVNVSRGDRRFRRIGSWKYRTGSGNACYGRKMCSL